jgi:hypothetical protein
MFVLLNLYRHLPFIQCEFEFETVIRIAGPVSLEHEDR